MQRAVRASMTQIGGRTLPGPMPRNACFIIVMPCVTLRLPRRKGWGLSVFSLTDRCTGVCLRGVKYRLEDAVLTNRVPLGVSNEFAAPEAEISLTQGILMIAQTKK